MGQVYWPNTGEQMALRALVGACEIKAGLYKNVISFDGALQTSQFTEWTIGGSRAYDTHTLANSLNNTSLVASQWYVSENISGKGQVQWCETSAALPYLEWTFNSYDVADAATVQGMFAYTFVIPFDAGVTEIKAGDIIRGNASGATAVVTAVYLMSGTWASTAAGWLMCKTLTGTWQDGEYITIKGAIATVTIVSGGTGYAIGDIITVTQSGGAGAKFVVLTLGGSNAIATVAVVDGGQGYSTATGLPVVYVTGSGGSTATITIASVGAVTKATTNTGTSYGGDAIKLLLWAYSLTTPKLVDSTAVVIRINPIHSLSTA